MTYAVTDFKSIKRIIDRQEQKAEFEEKNPKPPAWYSNAIVWTSDWTVVLDNQAVVTFTQEQIRISRSYTHGRGINNRQMKAIIRG